MFKKFGENIPGYSVPVLNERQVRAAAGMLFLLMAISLIQVLFKANFLPVKYAITLFLTDLLIRVFINPGYSPFLIAAGFIVSNQPPDYVGAAQKKFAWLIGIGLSGLMFTFLVVLNIYTIAVGITCFLCLAFLFFETAFGICLGCIVYHWIYRKQVAYCSGGCCISTNKDQNRKKLFLQILALAAFLTYLILILYFFHNRFSIQPQDLSHQL